MVKIKNNAMCQIHRVLKEVNVNSKAKHTVWF